jgi:hypothetical protein
MPAIDAGITRSVFSFSAGERKLMEYSLEIWFLSRPMLESDDSREIDRQSSSSRTGKSCQLSFAEEEKWKK